ncbi:MAG: MFS transporter [Desulfovibrio sp.]|nr:MFS transporter [Desulfovibrio sp.]MBI4958243.1 MFS transporter [Desulfovibrio sp.]
MSTAQRRMYLFLLVTTIASQIGMQGWVTLINNFGVEAAGLNAFQMGMVQSVREIPGFLSLLVIYVLLVLTEHRAAALSLLLLGVGVAASGLVPSFWGIVFTTLLMSTGFHYFETLNQSLSLQYFSLEMAPVVLGRLRAASAIANIAVGLLIFFLASSLSYPLLFMIVGGAVALMGLWAVLQDPSDKSLPAQHKKMILRSRYWLFYALTFLSGARRQIFMVFAAFLLVKKFDYTLTAMSALFVANNLVAWVANPIIGRMINRFGERALMSLEYASTILVFSVYAYTDSHILAGAMFIIDNLTFNFSVCIRTYLQKIADKPDIAPSSAVGFTINHIAAVFIPAMGGWLWIVDYRIPFLAGAAMGVMSLALAQFVRTEQAS